MRAWLETKLGEVGGHPGFTEFWLQVKGHEDEWPKPTCFEIREQEKVVPSTFEVTWSWCEEMSRVPDDYEGPASWYCSISFTYPRGWYYATDFPWSRAVTLDEAHRGLCVLAALKCNWRGAQLDQTLMKPVNDVMRERPFVVGKK